MITGITLIKDGEKLKYPWVECIKHLLDICDKVIINYGISSDNTILKLEELSNLYPDKIDIIVSDWNMENTGDGRELAIQANQALAFVETRYPQTDWIIYTQADEIIHEKDYEHLLHLMNNLSLSYTQIELYRTYFWKNLQTRNREYEIWLGRIFRLGTHLIGGDGMYLERYTGNVFRSNAWIYHYSRIGTEEVVTQRLRTLDRLFHPEIEVIAMGGFKYTSMNSTDLVSYTDTHPALIDSFYKGLK